MPEYHPKFVDSRGDYDRLVELGHFEDAHVEYLRGAIVARSPQGPPHADTTMRLHALLFPALVDRARIRVQCPLAISENSEPEPDVAVVPLGDYKREHPTTAHLIVEVAHTSLPMDRGLKRELYAESGILEYWIVNLRDRVIEVHMEPRDGRYTLVTVKRPGDVISLKEFPDVCIHVGLIV